MKIGTRVKIVETGQIGKVHAIDPWSKKATHVQLNTGEIVSVMDKTILILSILKWFWTEIKKLFN